MAEYESALADFKDAYRAKADPALLYNIAQCHRKLGHTEEAISAYQTYLRRAPDAKNRDEVQRRIRELRELRDGQATSPAATESAAVAPPAGEANSNSRDVAASPGSAFPSPGIETTGVAASPSPAPALDLRAASDVPAAAPEPVYKRWWFWTAAGVAVAGAATAIIVVATTRDPTKIPSSSLGSQRALP